MIFLALFLQASTVDERSALRRIGTAYKACVDRSALRFTASAEAAPVVVSAAIQSCKGVRAQLEGVMIGDSIVDHPNWSDYHRGEVIDAALEKIDSRVRAQTLLTVVEARSRKK